MNGHLVEYPLAILMHLCAWPTRPQVIEGSDVSRETSAEDRRSWRKKVPVFLTENRIIPGKHNSRLLPLLSGELTRSEFTQGGNPENPCKQRIFLSSTLCWGLLLVLSALPHHPQPGSFSKSCLLVLTTICSGKSHVLSSKKVY